MKKNENIDNNTVSDIYEYIKCVDEKVMQNDKTLKFMSSMQSEQMKELIQSKTDNLKKFFEDAIRLQTEVVRNAYEEVIENLKASYEEEIKKIELNNLKINNQKEETLKAAYENQKTALVEAYENQIKSLREAYENQIKSIHDGYENRIKSLCDGYELQITTIKNDSEREKQREIGERLYEKDEWHKKNLQNKLDEQKNWFWNEMEKRSHDSYENGKADVMAWHDDVVRQKLEVQAQYFYEEIEKAKQEAYKHAFDDGYQQGYEHGKNDMKAELYAEMDEAAKRNEVELKLFLDYYENKIKPFKKLINLHEATDRNLKTLQRKIKNRINKTLGRQDLIIQPDTTYEKCRAKEEELKNSDNNKETGA
ncbi:MAG: hypothetical protein K6C94_05980 [Candidatus Gastranaerophilales bacterium]|nr:hypothetical protein [Candidatus Gastranaerophilales bacterium]